MGSQRRPTTEAVLPSTLDEIVDEIERCAGLPRTEIERRVRTEARPLRDAARLLAMPSVGRKLAVRQTRWLLQRMAAP